MENTTNKILKREEKKQILDFTLDNLAKGALKGLIFYIIFSKIKVGGRFLPLFAFSYCIGMSLRESNEYLVENFSSQINSLKNKFC